MALGGSYSPQSRRKIKRPDERPVPEDLTTRIEKYLTVYRPTLGRRTNETNALWLAINGKPMSPASIAELIPETTRMAIGVAVNPHMFRTAAVTTLATRAGDKPHAGSAVLHHRPGPVTQQNYNRASCIIAGKSLAGS
jgi:site-specific recombinase XerD